LSLPPDKRELPVEDISFRDPEWEVLERAAGQGPSEGRVIYWDPIHGWLRTEGPKWIVKKPERPY
jgi:hypothetical protein